MNHYERLKVSQDAPPEVIRAAYRALAAKLHPDRQQGATGGPEDEMHAQMAALNQAYEVLIDPKLRQDYDATLAPARARVSEGSDADTLSPDAAEGPSTRVDMDWLAPKPPASSLRWPPSRRMMILGGAGVAAVALAGGSWLWQMQGQHQMERALSKQYANTQGSESSADVDELLAASSTEAQKAAERIVERDVAAAAGRKEGDSGGQQSSSSRHRPSVEELSRMSDEELLKVLPTLDGQDGGSDVATLVAQHQQYRRAQANGGNRGAKHPLDGKPLSLRTDTNIVETLPSDNGGKKNRP